MSNTEFTENLETKVKSLFLMSFTLHVISQEIVLVYLYVRGEDTYVEMEFIMLICLEEINLNKEFFGKKLEHS